MHSNLKITDRILTAVFPALLGLISLGTIFSWDFHDFHDFRGSAQQPDITSVGLYNFPVQFESYLNDHFAFRNTLVRRYNKLIKVRLGHESKKVLTVEGNRWLFLKKTILDYLGHMETSTEDLERWRRVLEGRCAWLMERGICYLFVVPPNKATIYSEYLPKQIRMVKEETRLEKFIAYMKENSFVPILDLREALFEDKKHRQVYFSTDTHWNGFGIFTAYQQLILKIKHCLPEISDPLPFDIKRFTLFTVVGDLVDRGGVEKDEYSDTAQSFSVDGMYSYSQTENTDAWVLEELSRMSKGNKAIVRNTYNPENKLCAVFFHDSFFPGKDYLMARHFGAVHNLWFRADYDLVKKAVESYHPDVVVDEVQERALYIAPKDHPEWAAARKRYYSKK